MNRINVPLNVLPNGPYVVACKDPSHNPVVRYLLDGVWYFCEHDLKPSKQQADPQVLSYILQSLNKE